VRLGPRLRDMQGYVRTTVDHFHMNSEQGEFYGEFTWRNSWEAESHLQHFGRSGKPVCWMNTGYASAFGTSAFGKPVLARETECMAMGHAQCRIVMQQIDSLQAGSDDDLRFLQVEDFVDLPRRRNAGPTHRNDTLPLSAPSPLQQELVGASTAFNSVVYLLKRVGQTDATVLFLGESGVGKERFSRTLHQIGPRADGPFVSVNCAAIPADLVEAELFGVERGAYTGATASRPGRFERADGGTLFLDEIGSLPLPAQGKLLRALQEREIERVGGTAVHKVNVRVVAATNDDLRQAMEAGRFRADLFYRLNVFPIRIPPLRERREDIPLMLNVFVERFCKRFAKPVKGITRQALDALWHYPFPGNVRELENMVERAVILADADGAIDVHHLFSGGEAVEMQSLSQSLSVSPTGTLVSGAEAGRSPAQALMHRLLDQGYNMADVEQALIACALERHRGKLVPAARALGLGRGQMQYRVGKLKAQQEAPEEPEAPPPLKPKTRPSSPAAAQAPRRRRA
jgi:transcriptional regulator with GAF, ATPase, and Fis domain